MKIATLDFETDPFKFGRIPRPFACGIYRDGEYVEYWSDRPELKGADVIEWAVSMIRETLSGYTVYAHNGGKFDFMYLLDQLENPLKIINGRIVQAKIGDAEIRDSYSILPIALADYHKETIDYSVMEKNVRQKHKDDILYYLAKDCEYLYDLVKTFTDSYGDKLTIGACAIAELKKLHPFKRTRKSHDDKFRPFFYGGRVECFKPGIHNFERPAYYIDVNSMYPSAMRNFQHPAGNATLFVGRDAEKIFDKKTGKINGECPVYFAEIVAKNNGALPFRITTKDKTLLEDGFVPGLNFNVPRATFNACSHEIYAALELGLIEIEHVLSLRVFSHSRNFAAFVDKFHALRVQAKSEGSKAFDIIYKLISNSSYGKFAQNPERFCDWRFSSDGEGEGLLNDGWKLEVDYGRWELWYKPNPGVNYFDVSIAASITSAARSILLRAIHSVKTPYYCDTDSLICEAVSDYTDLHESRLGAWKIEGMIKTALIAGKKMYAVELDKPDKKGNRWKLATKGVRLTVEDVRKLCTGGTVDYQQDSPKFGFKGDVQFLSRSVAGEQFRKQIKKRPKISKVLKLAM